MVYTNPVLAQESLPDFYNEEYYRLNYGRAKLVDHLYDEEQGHFVFQFVREFLTEMEKDELIVAEIGCGASDILKFFKDRRDEIGKRISVYGTEYSEEYIVFAANKYDISVLKGGTEALVERKIKADLLVLSHVFEHMIDIRAELALIKKVVSKGGIVYIEVPGITGVHNGIWYEHDFTKFHTLAHIYNFSLRTLGNVMQQNGFEIIKGDEVVRVVTKRISKGMGLKPIESDYPRIERYLRLELPYHRQRSPYRKRINKLEHQLADHRKSLDWHRKRVAFLDQRVEGFRQEIRELKRLRYEATWRGRLGKLKRRAKALGGVLFRGGIREGG